jgi:hypothetical protein
MINLRLKCVTIDTARVHVLSSRARWWLAGQWLHFQTCLASKAVLLRRPRRFFLLRRFDSTATADLAGQAVADLLCHHQ